MPLVPTGAFIGVESSGFTAAEVQELLARTASDLPDLAPFLVAQDDPS